MFIARFVGSLVDNVSILLPYDTPMHIFRVEEYLNFGKDMVNPASSKDKATDLSKSSDQVDGVNYPESVWGTSLASLPFFTPPEMGKHITRSGKNIGNKDHHYVPTPLRKAKTFLVDEYLHEIIATRDDKCFYVKVKCCHSYRKKKTTHCIS